MIFANLALQPGDDTERLRSLGLPVSTPRSSVHPKFLAQPCAAFDGCHCRVYADRPQYCRQFECLLLKSVKAGQTEPAAALRIIRTARNRADKVRRLLRALGDADEQLPLSKRFRRTSKRLGEQDLEEGAAGTYAQLTLAVHDLNLLLSDAFYPGSTRMESKSSGLRAVAVVAGAALALFAATHELRADQVALQNGDRYVGNVLTVNSNTVVLQSDVLGTLRLPRGKVATITLGTVPVTSSPALPLAASALPPAPSAPSGNQTANLPSALGDLGASSNLIAQVQKQLLGGAGEGANTKFNDLLGGLMNGSLNVDDIRAQAKTAADQLRAYQRESGEGTGLATSAYLAILDHFLRETAPSTSATNGPASASSSKPKPAGPKTQKAE